MRTSPLSSDLSKSKFSGHFLTQICITWREIPFTKFHPRNFVDTRQLAFRHFWVKASAIKLIAILDFQKTLNREEKTRARFKTRMDRPFHLFTFPKYLTLDSHTLPPFGWLSKVRDKRIEAKENRKTRPSPCRKFATLTRRRCGKTHKKGTPRNRRQSKWREAYKTKLKETTDNKVPPDFCIGFSSAAKCGLLNPKQKINLIPE